MFRRQHNYEIKDMLIEREQRIDYLFQAFNGS